MVILDDANRFFLSSRFLWLEVMPKAVYFRNEAEIDFYRTYFEKSVRVSLEALEDIGRVTQLAADEAQRCGLSAMDALHVAAAYLLNADEFITLERPGSAIYRASLLRVVCLAPAP